MLQNTIFAALYILYVFRSKKREAHRSTRLISDPSAFVQLVATRHSFERFKILQPDTLVKVYAGLCKPTFFKGVSNPTLPLGLWILQPNLPCSGLRFCNQTLLLRLRVLQPNTLFRGVKFCHPSLLLEVYGLATQQSF